MPQYSKKIIKIVNFKDRKFLKIRDFVKKQGKNIEKEWFYSLMMELKKIDELSFNRSYDRLKSFR